MQHLEQPVSGTASRADSLRASLSTRPRTLPERPPAGAAASRRVGVLGAAMPAELLRCLRCVALAPRGHVRVHTALSTHCALCPSHPMKLATLALCLSHSQDSRDTRLESIAIASSGRDGSRCAHCAHARARACTGRRHVILHHERRRDKKPRPSQLHLLPSHGTA